MSYENQLAELKETLAQLKDALAATAGLWKHSPAYIEAVANVEITAKREREKYNSKVLAAEKRYNDCFARYFELVKQPDLPEEIQEVFASIRHGVDWGPIAFRLRWRSASNKHAIITIPGSQQWSGRGQGQTTYTGARSYLINLDWWRRNCKGQNKHGVDVMSRITVRSIMGKLDKETLALWTSAADDLIKEVTDAPTENKDS